MHRRADENLRALADRGGVVGVCQLRPFLTLKKQDNLHTYFDHIRRRGFAGRNPRSYRAPWTKSWS